METRARTSSGMLKIKTGTEGPRHDPYSYTETTMERNGDTVTLHEGLGDWLRVNGAVQDVRRSALGSEERRTFVSITGYTPEQLRRFVDRAHSRCRSCGGQRTRSERGHPGETLLVCDRCGDIVGTRFNRSAIE